MAITDSQKVDYLFKKLGYNVTKTDTAAVKSPSNESIASPISVRGGSIWTQSDIIPATIPVSNSSVVTLYTDATSSTVQAVNDGTASANRTWKTNLTDWIDASFGSTYQVKIYLATTGNSAPQTYGTQLFADGSGNNDEWFFDYTSGVLNFIGTSLPSVSFTGKSIFVVGARYAGNKGLGNLGNVSFGGNISTDGNIVANGYITSNSGIYGTVLTGNQPYITNLANINVDSITIGGNITISGNTNGGVINADELYEANYRVLTTNTTITVTGDAYGSGTYSNIALTLQDTGVSAGVYGAADDEIADRVPKITVDSKGRITNIANVTLSQVGNVTFTDTTISTTSNITLAPGNGYIFANNSVISSVADPLLSQDVVTLNYLNTQLENAANILIEDDSILSLNDDGVDPGSLELILDSNVAANISAAHATFYSNIITVGNLNISDRTISSAGNIVIDAEGAGIVQIVGADALGIPNGNTATRPLSPLTGYTRFNTEISSIEYWDGVTWTVPGASLVTSESITPNGSDNTYTLSSNATTYGVFVSINGTVQQPVTAYTVHDGNQITFSETPNATDIIEIRNFAIGITVTTLNYGNAQVTLDADNVNVKGNLLPGSDAVYDLGSSAKQWDSLYLSGSATVQGQTVVGGNIVIGNTYVPTANTSPGTPGQIVWDNGYVYICVSTNNWKRANLSAW